MFKGSLKAALLLAIVLNLAFFPALWGNKSLLLSSRDAPSVTPQGALHQEKYAREIRRTPDPGAPAWTIEPWFKIISNQYWHEHEIPQWNPYAAYGKPLAATQQPQPYYPLAVLVSMHVSPRAFNFFLVGRLFIAGVLMFLFARQFLKTLPSLAAAISFMLSGYFTVLLNMPHLSVEVLIPGVLLTFEQVLRRNSWLAVSLAAVMIFCAVVGGMPESLFLAISFGCAFVLFRLLAVREYRTHSFGRLAKFSVALILGFGLSALLLVPFAELAQVAVDSHQLANTHGLKAGLIADNDWRTTVLYLLPLLFGPVTKWGYWGIMPCLLAAVAVLRSLFPNDSLYSKSCRRLTGFFSVSLALLLLKRLGSPIINWVGALPISDVVLFLKYEEPLMAVCVAMLAGIGLSLLTEQRVRPYVFPLAVFIVAAVTLALAACSLPPVLGAGSFIFYGVLAAGMAVVLAAVTWVALTMRASLVRWRMPGLLALLTAELFANFILPSFYLLNNLPSQASNPYLGASYINFIQEKDRDYSRIFGRNGFLYPNWSGAFELADVRSLDAMEYRPYFTFIRNFLLKPEDKEREHGDLADRFTGGGEVGYNYNFATDAEQRFLVLSSIKYLISPSEYDVPDSVVKDIVAQHQEEKIWGFGEGQFPIGNGHEANGVFEHPPSTRIAYKTTINPTRPIFTGILSIKEAAQSRTDGAGFTLEIEGSDEIQPLFHVTLNPRDVPADRAGHAFRVDLSKFAGQDIKLLFSTDPGPSGNNAFDWAGWARLQFVSEDTTSAANASPFKPIYDGEVFIYEVAGVLPRAALYSAAEVLPDDQVLARLKASDFDPKQKVIISRESISPDDETATSSFSAAPGSPVHAAAITAYQPEHVQIEAETDAPALLMLNDTDYPGWQATVNGTRVPIMQADYLFRGVMVPAGKSTVEFDYEPRSFRLGAEISAVSLFGVIALPLAFRRRNQNPKVGG